MKSWSASEGVVIRIENLGKKKEVVERNTEKIGSARVEIKIRKKGEGMKEEARGRWRKVRTMLHQRQRESKD